jgi:GGDEF domain-containing protein
MAINEQFGREAGNQVIIDFSHILEEIGEEFGFVGRNGGNEFLLVIEKCTKEQMEDFFTQLNARLKRYNVLTLNNPIAIRYGYALNEGLHFTNFSEIITEVYSKVHLGKYNF